MMQNEQRGAKQAACGGRWRAVVFLLLAMSAAIGATAAEVSFNHNIRPILSGNCFDCHGPDSDARKADLRLDSFAGATAEGAIVPRKPDASEILKRLTASDPDDRMPPAETKRKVSPEQIAKLRQWIQEGAKYQEHWAFIPPVREKMPTVQMKSWVWNDIDRFVLARLEKEGLAPSPPADRYTLIKRVYLDLTGLPPTPEEADAFARDKSTGAYEKVVDGLLKSEHYGERWARKWLDIARYSDTNGYEKDRPRSMWPYRDWVINAINSGMPFDQFTIEQLAGDMLPDATASQRVATGFHRNTMLNEEGGIDPLEFRFYAMVDRVNTTGTAWLGLTLMCVQCHTHKYDPIEHSEYYRVMAYLNNADEPDMEVPSPELSRQRRKLEFDIAMAERNLVNRFPFPNKIKFSDGARESAEVRQLREEWVERRFSQWVESERKKAVNWTILKPEAASSTLPKLSILDDHSVLASGDQTKRDIYRTAFKTDVKLITAMRLEVLPHESLPAGGPGFAFYEGPKGDFFLSELTVRADGRDVKLKAATETYAKNAIGRGKVSAALTFDGDGGTGWSTAKANGKRHVAVYPFAEPLEDVGTIDVEMLFERHYPAGLGRFRISVADAGGEIKATDIPEDVERLLGRPPGDWGWEEKQTVFRHFLAVDPGLKEPRDEIAKLRARLPAYPVSLVMRERPTDHPRATHRHHRGEYTQAREAVGVGTPKMFRGDGNAPKDRLGFARWLVSGKNPLTGRVVMNRHWESFFGRGLVVTTEDFGTQSSPPSHPRLLDWLGTELVGRKWSLKAMHKLIVMSATYRQASTVSAKLQQRDPVNVLLARGPRTRIDAEMVRDLALAVSGLLTVKVGGPSVFPPQPASVTDLSYGKYKWATSQGPDRYRRSLYTFAKRTAPFAAYLTFDGVSGESCVVKRNRSNTPLQALTLLNDQVFVEAAQSLGKRAHQNGGAEYLLRRCLIRMPVTPEIEAVIRFQKRQSARLNKGGLKAAEIVAAADEKSPDVNEIAAWTMTARAVLNFDETITKE
jgi:mono/diheme cytochrome c family protein